MKHTFYVKVTLKIDNDLGPVGSQDIEDWAEDEFLRKCPDEIDMGIDVLDARVVSLKSLDNSVKVC